MVCNYLLPRLNSSPGGAGFVCSLAALRCEGWQAGPPGRAEKVARLTSGAAPSPPSPSNSQHVKKDSISSLELSNSLQKVQDCQGAFPFPLTLRRRVRRL